MDLDAFLMTLAQHIKLPHGKVHCFINYLRPYKITSDCNEPEVVRYGQLGRRLREAVQAQLTVIDGDRS